MNYTIQIIVNTSQLIYNYVDGTLCYLQGGRFHNNRSSCHDRHLACNLYLKAMTTEAVVNYIDSPRSFASFSLHFQTKALQNNKFQEVYNATAYSHIFHRLVRKVIALPAAGFKVIQAIFLDFIVGIYHQRNCPVQLTYHHWFFISKCDLYIAWGYLSSLWNAQAGLERIHRGQLEKWNNSWQNIGLTYEDRARVMIKALPDKIEGLTEAFKKSTNYISISSFLDSVSCYGKFKKMEKENPPLKNIVKLIDQEILTAEKVGFFSHDKYLTGLLDLILNENNKHILLVATKIICMIKNKEKREEEWNWMTNKLNEIRNTNEYKFYCENLPQLTELLNKDEATNLLQLNFQREEFPSSDKNNPLINEDAVLTIFTKTILKIDQQEKNKLPYLLCVKKYTNIPLKSKEIYIEIFVRSFCYEKNLDSIAVKAFIDRLIKLKNNK